MKMINNTIEVFILMMLLFSLSSCEDFINIDQGDIVEAENNALDYQTLNSSVLGNYALLGDLTEQLFIAGELRGDLVVVNQNADSYIKEFSANSFSAGNPYVSSRGFYSIINNTNRLIIENQQALKSGILDSLDFNALRSELIGLRGWTYFQIVKNYGSCKFYTEALEYPSAAIPVLDYQQSIDTILSDVLAVDTLNFFQFSDGANGYWNRIRVLQHTINTLMGELYMAKGDYDNAAGKFEEVVRKMDETVSEKEVVSDNNFKLSSYVNNDWRKIFNSKSVNSEGLFWIFSGKEENQFNDLQKWTATPAKGGAYIVKPSLVAVDNFHEAADYYRGENASFRKEGSQYYINKYIMDRSPNENDAQFFLYRAGRLHLLWAECLNRLGQTDRALEVLNNGTHLGEGVYTGGVRKRVNLDPIVIPAAVRDEMLYLEDKIVDELALETAFEGNRWYDLVRVAERRNDEAWLINKVIQKFPEEEREQYRDQFTREHWYLPSFN